MDPLYLNLALNHQGGTSALSGAVSIDVGHVNTALSQLSQINGLSQESKLATYLSNRQQPQLTANQLQPGGLSQLTAAQLHANSQSQLPPGSQAQLSVLNPSLQIIAQPTQSLSKSLAGLSLDTMVARKKSVGGLPDFLLSSSSGSSGSLAHSSSTPSFHNFPGLGTSGLSTSSGLQFTLSNAAPITSSPPCIPSPPPQASPVRGVSAPPSAVKHLQPSHESSQTSASISTYQENVGGTTYFYNAQDMSIAGAGSAQLAPKSLVFPPYHVLPVVPSHIHHLRSQTNAPQFFMGEDLRHDLLERQALTMAQVEPDEFPDLPHEVDMYHELVPLELNDSINKSSMFGYTSSVYKATNQKTGLHYCLYRIHGYRLSNVKVTQIVELWKKIQHSSVVQLREVFTTKDFGDNSIVFVFDFHAGAETLSTRHLSGNGLNPASWERLTSSLNGNNSFAGTLGGQDGVGVTGMLPESALWNYIIQLTGAIRAIHTQGLACRTLNPSKILLTDNKSRIRMNCCGILDILNFDPNSSNPLAAVPTYQQDDLVSLGKLMVALACNSYLALQRENISSAIDLINRYYSRDLAMLVVCLLTSQRIKTINDVMPMIGARFYTALESATQRGDVYESELGKELHNGRLLRLLTKLQTVVDRPQLNSDSSWSETGDRYMLKLFRDYVFHQQSEDGRPWLDLGHIIAVLNKLEASSPDKICLMSHDEQNVFVVSYSELKRCFECSFQELLQAASVPKNAVS